MTAKKNVQKYVVIGICICILYTIFASTPLSKEYQFTPTWELDIHSEKQDVSSPLFHFKLGQTMGYFSEDGKIALLETFPFRCAISDHFFASYNTNNTKTLVRSQKNEELFTIEESGFPLFSEDRIYMFLPGGSSFSYYDKNGTKLWQYQGVVPITSFFSNENCTLAGFANGKVHLLSNENGQTLHEVTPGGSVHQVILGAAVSSDNKMIATLSGQNPQRFVLNVSEKNQSKILFSDTIASSDARQRLVLFSNDNNFVYYDTKDSFFVMNTQNGKKTSLPIKEQVLMVQENSSLIFLLAKENETYTVYTLEKPATLCSTFSFKASSAFIKLQNDKLFIGKDSKISSINISQK